MFSAFDRDVGSRSEFRSRMFARELVETERGRVESKTFDTFVYLLFRRLIALLLKVALNQCFCTRTIIKPMLKHGWSPHHHRPIP